ncbi:unnamed protein product [marine sediment metagenome]|uniref:PEGA domain-containing protein n=1 Tax=marine sediment metagenome TaxID=412755 RepID=X1SK51_9ZZZZ
MAEERRISPVVIAAGAGVAIGIGALLYFLTRAEAAPPTPPPGLANLYGKVTDAVTGRPIPQVRVMLNGLETYTNAGGNYAFTDLEPGEYVLQFSKEGYEPLVY